MPVKTRFFIALGLAAVFLLVAPLVVIYSSGHEYDWKKRQWFSPGWIILESKPFGAAVYLNGRDTGQVTPTTIKHLGPGDYFIEIKAAGYHQWRKKLAVKASTATFVSDVLLIKQEAAAVKELFNQNFDKFSLSPGADWLALFSSQPTKSENRIIIFNVRTGQIQRLTMPGSKIENVLWDDLGKANALVRLERNQAVIYRDADHTLEPVSLLPLKNWRLLDNTIWASDNQKIYKATATDLRQSPKQYLTAWSRDRKTDFQSIANFSLVNGILYIIDNDPLGTPGNPRSRLYAVTESIQTLITSLPRSNYEFVPGSLKYLTLLSQENQLYLIDPKDSRNPVLPTLIAPAQMARWDNDGQRLLFITPRGYLPSEAHVWHEASGQTKTMARLSSTMTMAAWAVKDQYLLFNNLLAPTSQSSASLNTKLIALSDETIYDLLATGLAQGSEPTILLTSPDSRSFYVIILAEKETKILKQDF